MKHLKNRSNFLNESIEEEAHRVGAINNVNFNVDEEMDSIFVNDHGTTTRAIIEDIISDLSLASGFIKFHDDFFNTEGVSKDGMKIHIRQFGKFSHYGGPSTPHMDKPEVEFNGIDVYPFLHHDFKQGGYIEEGEYVDITRTDMYPWDDLMKYINDPVYRDNFLNSSGSIKKYNM